MACTDTCRSFADGGGVRGLAALVILQDIMDKMFPGQKPCEAFDMIAGTSTGGYILLMLSALTPSP